ncbi:FMN-binding negative transcriptional regulator [Tsukamurella sp. 8F]|uniref:FMN-binding negative transcriptional regulator n=1 Tax=unclassified Tsukamurella TaxID=2633480 RepID=UPI0023B99B82|nr:MULTISPECIES: FMN-binding negative transcriptional regulator [unclassified Tsukamurella]MDF0530630.1 FMN-binding negative transcriptional regulator [Tsukamurella sp. 8J]MDF0587831.1 FMN-binding negative transcriptional regulator [Tsukamurella sp. 8F]
MPGPMYVPAPNRTTDSHARELVAAAAIGTLFTAPDPADPLALYASTVPVLWDGDEVLLHLARANPQVRTLDASACLLVVTGPDGYVSPSYYPSKREHGRVVPTWNYSEVQLRGRATVVDGKEAVRDVVERLTGRHETPRADPWRVDDAPEPYIEQQLRAIVGVRIAITDVRAKAKWSQSRSGADVDGVLDGLAADGSPAALAEMRRANER